MFSEDYVADLQNWFSLLRMFVGEGVILLNDSTGTRWMTLASRAILKGNTVTVVREQSRNDMLKHKTRRTLLLIVHKVQQQLRKCASY